LISQLLITDAYWWFMSSAHIISNISNNITNIVVDDMFGI